MIIDLNELDKDKLHIRLSNKFKKILNLPNYLISGFAFRFSPDLDSVRFEDTSQAIDDINLNRLVTASSYFNCSTMLLNGELNWSISAKDDANDDRYNYILIYYYDLMTKDFNESYKSKGSKLVNTINSDMELAAVIYDFHSLKRKQNVDIQNQINTCIKPKCSILTKKFNPDGITHIIRTDMTKSDYTNNRTTMDNTLLRYKPTESLLNDNSISMYRASDSFMISSSGLINIGDEKSNIQ